VVNFILEKSYLAKLYFYMLKSSKIYSLLLRCKQSLLSKLNGEFKPFAFLATVHTNWERWPRLIKHWYTFLCVAFVSVPLQFLKVNSGLKKRPSLKLAARVSGVRKRQVGPEKPYEKL